MDTIAGSSGTTTYTRQQLIDFLRRKLWIVEDVEVPQISAETEMPASTAIPVNTHIYFASSSSGDGSGVERGSVLEGSLVGDETVGSEPEGGEPEDVEPDEGQEEENEDSETEKRGHQICRTKPSERALRSTYVGRGDVGAVRAARRKAGMSDSFPK